MPDYRVYFRGKDGHFVRAVNLAAEDDATALASARAFRHHAPIEVWRGNSLVGAVEPGGKEKG